jgi:hypothetical protein
MLAYRSGLDSGSRWHILILTLIPIPTDTTDPPSMLGPHLFGTTGIASLSRDIPVFTVFTMFTMDNELT